MVQDARVLSASETAEALKSIGIDLTSELVLVARSPLVGRLRYSWSPVKRYLQEHCRPATNDCTDNVFPLDCTHFVSHALNKSGVFVKNPSADCASGLCVRVNDLAASFASSVSRYSNMRQLRSHAETRQGDFCFIPSWFGLSKEHVMVLHSSATAQGAKVFAHSNARCGEFVDYEGAACVYYRIDEVS